MPEPNLFSRILAKIRSADPRSTASRSTYRSAMPTSTLASTIEAFENAVRVKRESRLSSRTSSRRPADSAAARADPRPNQPGSERRHWLQAKTQGMARRSSMRSEADRDAGRLPTLSREISVTGVTDRKKAGNSGSSCTSCR